MFHFLVICCSNVLLFCNKVLYSSALSYSVLLINVLSSDVQLSSVLRSCIICFSVSVVPSISVLCFKILWIVFFFSTFHCCNILIFSAVMLYILYSRVPMFYVLMLYVLCCCFVICSNIPMLFKCSVF